MQENVWFSYEEGAYLYWAIPNFKMFLSSESSIQRTAKTPALVLSEPILQTHLNQSYSKSNFRKPC